MKSLTFTKNDSNSARFQMRRILYTSALFSGLLFSGSMLHGQSGDTAMIYGLGSNYYYQLGDPNYSDETRFKWIIPNTYNWAKLSNKYYSCMAVREDGTLWGWGWNDYGQTGISGSGSYVQTPTQIGMATNWATVSSGWEHSVALKNDSTLWGSGRNDYGQLGLDNGNVSSNQFVQVGVGKWLVAEAGYFSSGGIKANGTLWMWGDNGYAQVGQASGSYWPAPMQVGTDSNWVKLSVSDYNAYAIKSDGSLWGWGSNSGGQLATGSTFSYTHIPTRIGDTTSVWLDVKASEYYVLALRSDSTIWTWGYSAYGTLGDGISSSHYVYAPTKIGVATDWGEISTSKYTATAVKGNGQLWMWGWNATQASPTDTGGTTASYFYLPQVINVGKWSQIQLGYYTMLGLSRIAIDTTNPSPLPIALTKFVATLSEDHSRVALDWTTSSENNNHYFEVQKSMDDGKSYQGIGRVNGHGTTTEENRYQYIDNKLSTGISLYRLLQVDYDGKKWYSHVEKINNTRSDGNTLTIYPNPATREIKISGNLLQDKGVVRIRIFNMMGALISDELVDIPSVKNISIDQLSVGTYNIYITGNKGTGIGRFTKM